MNERYILLAVFVHSPGVAMNDIGRYTTAIKLNDTFEIFDDLKPKSYVVSKNKKSMLIHALQYIKK